MRQSPGPSSADRSQRSCGESVLCGACEFRLISSQPAISVLNQGGSWRPLRSYQYR